MSADIDDRMSNENHPDILSIDESEQFLKWYWLKEELILFCKEKGLSPRGKKFDLRDRILAYLDGKELQPERKKKPVSGFNWAKEVLTLDTRITDSVTFGKNFRGFMKENIGPRFVCHSDFMAWVRSHHGATLKEAIDAWFALEKRKENPQFKREIAPQNMLAQYTRDFFQDNPSCSREQMMKCWLNKKSLPTQGGKVIYEREDRKWI